MRNRSLVLCALALVAGCQEKVKTEFVDRDEPLPENSRPWKVASARSAAPGAIAVDAIVLDFPRNDTLRPEELVLGANGWTCWPDDPRTPADDPVCKDQGGMEWDYAVSSRRPPRITSIGMVYRLHGGASASDTDPTLTAPEPGAEWIPDRPYIALIPANPRMLAGIPTTRRNGGPWVKFSGTPWAMLILPGGAQQ